MIYVFTFTISITFRLKHYIKNDCNKRHGKKNLCCLDVFKMAKGRYSNSIALSMAIKFC